MPHITQQILTLLEDDSFPSMVMLDGEWGAGKTYYVKSELIPMLEKKQKKVFFFSLIGLSSIDDFRDKLISSVYLSEKVDNDLLGKLRNGAFAILNNTTDNGGTITSILKGSTGAVKHAMLNRINGITIILDDLERLSNTQLAKEIVGECLQLTDDNNLEFIFVMNGNETSIDKAMLEKSFSDRVYFKRKAEDSLEIIFKEFTYFDKYKDLIEKSIQKLEFTNLRVMKRAANRLNKIFEIVSKDKSIYLDKSMELIIKDVLRISYLHYCLEKTSEEIIAGLNFGLNLKLNVSKIKKDEIENTKDEFKKYRTTTTPSDEIIEYCCGKTHTTPSIDQLGNLLRKDSPIDEFMYSNGYALDEDKFKEFLKALENYIFTEKNVSLYLWFESCNFYLYLINKQFLQKNNTDFITEMDELLQTKNFNVSKENNRYRSLRINNPEILEKFNYQKEKSIQQKQSENNVLLFKRIKESWEEIDMEIYHKYRTENFINKYSANEWMQVIKGWKAKDIGVFSDFLKSRYEPSSIKNSLADEKKTLIELSHLIEKYTNDIEYGQKKGTLTLLKKAVLDGIVQLQP